METLTIKEKNEKLKTFIFQKFQDGELDNDTLVQLIEQAGNYLLYLLNVKRKKNLLPFQIF